MTSESAEPEDYVDLAETSEFQAADDGRRVRIVAGYIKELTCWHWIDVKCEGAKTSGQHRQKGSMADFVKVAKTNEIEPGQARLVDVQGKRIALFNVDGHVLRARQHVHA